MGSVQQNVEVASASQASGAGSLVAAIVQLFERHQINPRAATGYVAMHGQTGATSAELQVAFFSRLDGAPLSDYRMPVELSGSRRSMQKALAEGAKCARLAGVLNVTVNPQWQVRVAHPLSEREQAFIAAQEGKDSREYAFRVLH